MFYVRIEQFTIQNDHIHLLIRAGRRTNLICFFRVIAGQIAQEFEKLDLLKKFPVSVLKKKKSMWKNRPFTRVVLGIKAYRTARDYLQLNELEVTGVISYQKKRLRGLNQHQRKNLWNLNKLYLPPSILFPD